MPKRVKQGDRVDRLLCGMMAVVLLLAGGLVSCASPASSAEPGLPTAPEPVCLQVSVEEAQQLIDERDDLIVLCVGTEEEYDEGYIASAVLIPVAELSERLGEIDKSKAVLVYCRIGARSDEACQILADNGFSEVYDLMGGTDAWRKGGGEINYPLTIEDLVVTPVNPKYFKEPNRVLIGESYKIECIVLDSESSTFSYKWSAERGGISGEGSVVTWTAPLQGGLVDIMVTVSNDCGGVVSRSIELKVEVCSCVFE